MIAWRRASWPTRRSPWLVKATTEGVVRDPSALGITVGLPPSVAAITEFVVPRSIPTAVAIAAPSLPTSHPSRPDGRPYVSTFAQRPGWHILKPSSPVPARGSPRGAGGPAPRSVRGLHGLILPVHLRRLDAGVLAAVDRDDGAGDVGRAR